jgi:hypothetical protein
MSSIVLPIQHNLIEYNFIHIRVIEYIFIHIRVHFHLSRAIFSTLFLDLDLEDRFLGRTPRV